MVYIQIDGISWHSLAKACQRTAPVCHPPLLSLSLSLFPYGYLVPRTDCTVSRLDASWEQGNTGRVS